MYVTIMIPRNHLYKILLPAISLWYLPVLTGTKTESVTKHPEGGATENDVNDVLHHDVDFIT